MKKIEKMIHQIIRFWGNIEAFLVSIEEFSRSNFYALHRSESSNYKEMDNTKIYKGTESYVQYKYGEEEDFRLAPDWESWNITLCPNKATTTTTTTSTTTTTTATTTTTTATSTNINLTWLRNHIPSY